MYLDARFTYYAFDTTRCMRAVQRRRTDNIQINRHRKHHITAAHSRSLRSFARKAIAHGEETERAIALLSLIGKGGENHDSFPNVIMGRGGEERGALSM